MLLISQYEWEKQWKRRHLNNSPAFDPGDTFIIGRRESGALSAQYAEMTTFKTICQMEKTGFYREWQDC